jgi:hypothetical protein
MRLLLKRSQLRQIEELRSQAGGLLGTGRWFGDD